MNKLLQHLVNWGIIGGFVLTIIGCASIVSGTRQNVSISSVPTGAKVKIERPGAVQTKVIEWEGTAPATIKLKRKYEYLVTISMDGYKTAEVLLEHGMNGWVFGNLLFAGIPGLIIDLINGAAMKLEPDEISVTLVKFSDSMGEKKVYAVLQGLDDNGKLHVLPLQLIPGEE